MSRDERHQCRDGARLGQRVGDEAWASESTGDAAESDPRGAALRRQGLGYDRGGAGELGQRRKQDDAEDPAPRDVPGERPADQGRENRS